MEREGGKMEREGGKMEREGGKMWREGGKMGREGGNMGREGGNMGREGGKMGRQGGDQVARRDDFKGDFQEGRRLVSPHILLVQILCHHFVEDSWESDAESYTPLIQNKSHSPAHFTGNKSGASRGEKKVTTAAEQELGRVRDIESVAVGRCARLGFFGQFSSLGVIEVTGIYMVAPASTERRHGHGRPHHVHPVTSSYQYT
ncbi:hypothetical protein Pcinc_027262 [Petrolisthes cinctipes]|uniref:Uncharacterized protein n=1 Tax=Petrolisthes cinctipes TaxID=88211 RepID=A0AAE1F6E4_PETCI|nr:hypothetical protein Pcinc_027262 [Petrolisthes cinctipes]